MAYRDERERRIPGWVKYAALGAFALFTLAFTIYALTQTSGPFWMPASPVYDK